MREAEKLPVYEKNNKCSKFIFIASKLSKSKLRMFEDVQTKRDEVTKDWRKLHYEEIHSLYYQIF